MSTNRVKLAAPPSDVTGELGLWLAEVRRVINNTPTLSYFSGVNPNSNKTGLAGDIAVNVAPGSSVSRVWVKYGSVSAPDRTSWVTIA